MQVTLSETPWRGRPRWPHPPVTREQVPPGLGALWEKEPRRGSEILPTDFCGGSEGRPTRSGIGLETHHHQQRAPNTAPGALLCPASNPTMTLEPYHDPQTPS